MKKILLVAALLSAQVSMAQSVDSYIFKVRTGDTYTPLTSGTNLSSSLIWDEENFSVPMGFSADIGGKTVANFISLGGGITGPATDTSGVINVFTTFFASDLVDRGAISGTPSSPIRYQVTGTTPNRIFKFEVFNAGFYDEMDLYGTLDDSVNFQMWVYETSNIVELRYGTSKISNPSDYFYLGNSPLVGYLKDINLTDGTFTKGYGLAGNSSTPNVDSFTAFDTSVKVMDTYPVSGTTYRFIPKTVAASIGASPIAEHFKVYPTITADLLYIDNNQTLATQIQILNMNGQVVNNTSINKGKNTIDVAGLANGNYLLQLNNDAGKAVFRFVKK